MKKKNLIILIVFSVLALASCKKEKNDNAAASGEKTENEKLLTETVVAEVVEEEPEDQPAEEEAEPELVITPGINGQPDEADIADGHKVDIQKWFGKQTSSDGTYTIRVNSEYYYTYDRYCIPVEGERSDLNLIMLKEESNLYNPNDMGVKNKERCNAGCEFVPLARSKEPVTFNDQTSYWFKVTETEWIPGTVVCIQPGAFEKIPEEDFEIGMDYEKIPDGAWFIVKTDDGSSLRLRDSSNIKTGNIITSLPQGTWIYADTQTCKTDTIDGIDSRWYKLAYPEKGYVFGGYLEKQDGVYGLKFAQFDLSSYKHDSSNDYTYKVYSAPTTKSELLGEYEIQPGDYGYEAWIETSQMETVDGVRGIWLYVKEPVKGFIFGRNFIYK